MSERHQWLCDGIAHVRPRPPAVAVRAQLHTIKAQDQGTHTGALTIADTRGDVQLCRPNRRTALCAQAHAVTHTLEHSRMRGPIQTHSTHLITQHFQKAQEVIIFMIFGLGGRDHDYQKQILSIFEDSKILQLIQ